MWLKCRGQGLNPIGLVAEHAEPELDLENHEGGVEGLLVMR